MMQQVDDDEPSRSTQQQVGDDEPSRTTQRTALTQTTSSTGVSDDNRRVVDIYKDPGIWICLDEGCNSNCHGDQWAEML